VEDISLEIINRIVGYGEELLDQILFNPANWRVHPGAQQEALKGVLEEVGWVQNVIVNKTTGHLIDGHLRCQLAAREGAKTIPVTYVEVSQAEEDLILASLDPIAAMATTDKQKLEELLKGIDSESDAINKLLEDVAEANKIELHEFEETPEPQIDKAEELRVKLGVETGQLWQLGEHRLICGDSQEVDVFERLMNGGLARLVWTDPPYGVHYGEKLEAANPMGYRVRSIENDDLPADKLEEFIRSVLRLCAIHSVSGGAIYVACPAGTLLPALIASFAGSGFEYRWGLIWLKDQIVLSRADYHFKHENILYGWKPDGAHYFTPDRTQASVFEYPRPKKSEEHPTMKPVELVAHMIRNSSERGDVILEPFCGSGSTMLACEQLSRKCRAIEISPAYCAVTIQRWVDMTGGEPILVQRSNNDG